MKPPALKNDCFALPPGVEWTPVDVALDHLRQNMTPIKTQETLPVAGAAGRFLASDICALQDHPPFANSAVDGYALHGDCPSPAPLQQGRAAAGHPYDKPLETNHALRILTGAPIPQGADRVILQEDVTETPTHIHFAQAPPKGANIRPTGEDMKTGECILPKHHQLRPHDLATLCAAGHENIPVFRPLKVAVVSTGDEIVSGAVPDANRPMLLSLLQKWGHRGVDCGILPDERENIDAALCDMAQRFDVILTTGGASAGDEDHISALLQNHAIWRIAIKPGRPMCLGLWHKTPIFGLPGNPVAAFTCALIFARPALMQLAGGRFGAPAQFPIPAAFEKRKKSGRREYLRARLNDHGAAEIFPSEGSGRVFGLSWADGFVELPDEAQTIKTGDIIHYIPFSSFGL